MIEIFVWFEFLLSSRYLVGGMFAASSTPEVGEDWETIHHLSNLTVDQASWASWARCLLKFPIFSDSSQSWLSLIIIFNNLTNHSSEICHMTTIWPIKSQCVGPNLWPPSFHIWFPWHKMTWECEFCVSICFLSTQPSSSTRSLLTTLSLIRVVQCWQETSNTA